MPNAPVNSADDIQQFQNGSVQRVQASQGYQGSVSHFRLPIKIDTKAITTDSKILPDPPFCLVRVIFSSQ